MSLVYEMLNALVNGQETTSGLLYFLNIFSENIAMFQSLNILDLGSFLLFAISVRCLPPISRRLFEQNNTVEYLTVR